MSELPAPFVAPEVDLKDFGFTPIYRARLFGSAFHARASDSEWRGGVTLWLKSQDQSPAGSLPDDDVELCRLAELGRDIRAWRKIREGALRGWVKCSDGRLYNRVVAEVVNDQWQGKIDQRNKTLKARITALEKRLSQTDDAAEKEGIERLLQPLRQALLEQQKIHTTESVTDRVTGRVTGSKRRDSKGTGTGTGTGKGLDQEPPTPPKGGERFAEFWKAYPHRGSYPDPEKPAEQAFLRALVDGADAQTIIAGAASYAAAVAADGVEPRFVLAAKKWLRDGCWDAQKPQLAKDAPSESGERLRWRRNVDWFRAGHTWFTNVWGPAPGERDCKVPPDLLTPDERAAANGNRSAVAC